MSSDPRVTQAAPGKHTGQVVPSRGCSRAVRALGENQEEVESCKLITQCFKWDEKQNRKCNLGKETGWEHESTHSKNWNPVGYSQLSFPDKAFILNELWGTWCLNSKSSVNWGFMSTWPVLPWDYWHSVHPAKPTCCIASNTMSIQQKDM